MKLLRYGPAGQEKPGMLDRDGGIRDLSGVIPDLGPAALSPAALDKLRKLNPASLPAVPGTPRLGPCVAQVSKLVCVGLNYVDHAKEGGMQIPTEPVLFLKAVSSISGPDDDVDPAQRRAEGRLGGRARHRHRHQGAICERVGRAQACRGLLRGQRRLRAQLSARATRQLVERQERRHLLSAGSVAGDGRRGAGPAGARPLLRGQRPAHAERLDPQHDLQLRQDRSYISQFMTLMPGDVIPPARPPASGSA